MELDELRRKIDLVGLALVGGTAGDLGGLLVSTSSMGFENVVVLGVILELYVGSVVVLLVKTWAKD